MNPATLQRDPTGHGKLPSHQTITPRRESVWNSHETSFLHAADFAAILRAHTCCPDQYNVLLAELRLKREYRSEENQMFRNNVARFIRTARNQSIFTRSEGGAA